MDAMQLKKIALDLGADLCGIASIDRFGEAPEGFHPLDVLPGCKSVIVLAKSFLAGTLKSKSTIPYTIVRNKLSEKLDMISVELCDALEKEGIIAIPTGTIGPTEYDTKTDRTRSIISSKHAAVAAGLGTIGKNSLLITPEYGNMVWITAILTEEEFTPDVLIEKNLCSENCHLCIDICPVESLNIDNPEMKQNTCWEYAFGTTEQGGEWRIKCFKCRIICPHCFGTKNANIVKPSDMIILEK